MATRSRSGTVKHTLGGGEMAEGQGGNRNSGTGANSFAASAPTISLPKGGGAIRGSALPDRRRPLAL
jgi:hypothetical protein